MEDYPIENAEDKVPTNLVVNTFVKLGEEIKLNDYLVLNNWDIDLYYIDGSENHDLVVDNINLGTHTFTTKLINSTTPKRLIPLEGNITGDFAQYSLFYFKKDEVSGSVWHKVAVPEEYRGTDSDPYVSIKEVNGLTDGIDNDDDGEIDEIDEEKRPQLRYRIPYEDHLQIVENTNDLNLYYLNSNGDLEVLDTVVNVNKEAGYVEFIALISHFSAFALMEGTESLSQPVLESIQSPTKKQYINLTGTASAGKILNVYRSSQPGDFAVNDSKTQIGQVAVNEEGNFTSRLELEEGMNYFYLVYNEVKNSPVASFEVKVDLTPAEVSNVEQTPEPYRSKDKLLTIDFTSSEPGRMNFNIVDSAGQSVYQQEIEVNEGQNIIEWDGKDYRNLLLPDGRYQYQLSLFDLAGNFDADKSGYQSIITIDNTDPEFNFYQLTNRYFSPDSDSIQDELISSFTVSEPVHLEVKVRDEREDIIGNIEVSDLLALPYQLKWSGKVGGEKLAEGDYSLIFLATDKAGNQNIITEKVTIDILDPVIEDNISEDFYNKEIIPEINVLDQNLKDYKTTLNGTDFSNKTLVSNEAEYVLKVTAYDKAGNMAIKEKEFVIDKTKPEIEITGVEDGQYYNTGVKLNINVIDPYLDSTEIYLNDEIMTGEEIVIEEDGKYQLKVIAEDKAKSRAVLTSNFVLDQNPPQISIKGIEDGKGYNHNLTSEIIIEDDNLDEYKVLLDDLLYEIGTEIKANGEHLIRVTASDKAGNESVQTLNFIIDKVPPLAPAFLAGQPGDRLVDLNWYENTESDLAGYNLYRDGQKINNELIKESPYEDNGLINGQLYTYYVTAVDWLGNESKPSNEIEAIPGYDVKVTDQDLSYSPVPPYAGQKIHITSIIENTGYVPFTDLKIDYYDGEIGNELINQEVVNYLDIDEKVENQTEWNTILGEYGTHYINVFVDPLNEYQEINEEDNKAVLRIDLKEPLKFNRNLSVHYPWILIWGSYDEKEDINPMFYNIEYPHKVAYTEIELLKELRSGKYSTLILPVNSLLLGAEANKEIKQMVYGGNIDVLAFNYSEAYQPLLKDIFGIYFKDNKEVKDINLQVKENQFVNLNNVGIETRRVNIFGTSKGSEIGTITLDLPGNDKNDIQKVWLKTPVNILENDKYQITAKIYHGKGAVVESEQTKFYGHYLPLGIVDESHNKDSKINLRISEVNQDYVLLEIENTSLMKLAGMNRVVVEIKDEITGEVVSYLGDINYSKIYEGQYLDDFIVEKIENNYTFPGIVVNDYGKGRGLLFNFNFLNSNIIGADKDNIINEILPILMTVKNNSDPYLIGEFFPIEYTIENLVLPVKLLLIEEPPYDSQVYNYGNGELNSSNIYWYYEMEPDTITTSRYHLGLPLKEGTFTLDSEMNYYLKGEYKYYKNYPIDFNVLGDIQVINELEYLLNDYYQKELGQEINEMIDKLEEIKYYDEQDGTDKYKMFISEVLVMINEWLQLDIEDRDFAQNVHQWFIDLLNIYQHKWYESIK